MSAEDAGRSPAAWAGAEGAARAQAYPDWFKNRRRRTRSPVVNPVAPAVMVGLPILVLVAIVVYPTIWMAYHAFHDTFGLDALPHLRFAASAANWCAERE